MKAGVWVSTILVVGCCAANAVAQGKPPASAPARPASAPGHEPPPQAYTDCKGKKAGEAIQHSTPEGVVTATCQETPKGLVARPNQPKRPPPPAAK
jgi:hypothetical protein